MIVFMFLSRPPLQFGCICNWKCVKRGGECGLEIPAIFLFYVPENVIKLAKNKYNRDRRKLKRICKTMSKVKCIDVSYMTCYLEVLGCNVNLGCKNDVHYRGVSAT